jgi:ribosomal protein L32
LFINHHFRKDTMKNYKGISADDKHRVAAALKARGAGSCPRCNDSQWTVSEYSRIEVQETADRQSADGTTIPAVMIVCQHCGFIAQHALQPLGLWEHDTPAVHNSRAHPEARPVA